MGGQRNIIRIRVVVCAAYLCWAEAGGNAICDYPLRIRCHFYYKLVFCTWMFRRNVQLPLHRMSCSCSDTPVESTRALLSCPLTCLAESGNQYKESHKLTRVTSISSSNDLASEESNIYKMG